MQNVTVNYGYFQASVNENTNKEKTRPHKSGEKQSEAISALQKTITNQ